LSNSKVLIVIPARFGSTRFPGKPLAHIVGVPMIVRVYKRALRVKGADRVVVATDDRRIADVVWVSGGEAIMTSTRHRSGTSRSSEVAEKLPEYEIILNIQGDEPLFPLNGVRRLIEEMKSTPELVMATLASRRVTESELRSRDVVKVVCDLEGNALYFSRAPIPASRDRAQGTEGVLKHIGIYAFRRDFLLGFKRLRKGRLERIENLEQLRALENGFPIRVLVGNCAPVAVDRPADIKKVEKKFQKR